MSSRIAAITALLTLGLSLPAAVGPAAAQEAQAVRDALGRAQSGAERRAVESLLDRLRGASGQPAQSAQPQPAQVPLPSTTTSTAAQPAQTVAAALPAGAPAASVQPVPCVAVESM